MTRQTNLIPSVTGSQLAIPLGRAAIAALLLTVPSQAPAQDFVIGAADAAVVNKSTQSRRFTFAIPAGSLESALNAFTAVTGIQVLYDSALADGHTSPGVSGVLSSDAALDCILSGTYLAPIASSPDAITLMLDARKVDQSAMPVGAMPPPRAPVLALDTLQVEAPIVRGYEVYAVSVKYSIASALLSADAVKRRRYRTAVNVWVSPAGAVQHSEIYTSTGDRALDAMIIHIILGVGHLGKR